MCRGRTKTPSPGPSLPAMGRAEPELRGFRLTRGDGLGGTSPLSFQLSDRNTQFQACLQGMETSE